jgi:hypothetical protein
MRCCMMISMLVFSAVMFSSEAYQVPSLDKRIEFSLKAWSLPAPPSSFGTFKSTWYNEVDNPTARTTVYAE